MIAGVVALAFRRHGVPTSDVETVSNGVYKFTVYIRKNKVPVYVVLNRNAEIHDDNAIIIPFVETNCKGKMLSKKKIDLLLRKVGLSYDTLRSIISLPTEVVEVTKSPSAYIKKALKFMDGFTVVFTLPMMFPYIIADVEYKVVKRRFFSKKVEVVRGSITVNPFTLSYCRWIDNKVLCDNVFRRPPPPEDFNKIRLLEPFEGMKVTADGVAVKTRTPIDKVMKVIDIAEKYGFVIPYNQRVFQVTRIRPIITHLPKLRTTDNIPLEWSYFPFMCINSDVITGSVRFIRMVAGDRIRRCRLLFMPYIVVGGVKYGKKKVVAYGVVEDDENEVISELLYQYFDCLYVLSKG